MSDPAPIPWWQAEPSRLAKDRQEISAAFPGLGLSLKEGQGHWAGRLPVWPFERPAPDGLDRLVPAGAHIVLAYTPAYPIVSPYVFPVEPEPLPLELTQTRWHVLGNGALCLFQTQADWDPASSVVGLLTKAAGWRIEYALLKAGAREDMTMAGLANDGSLDALVTETAATLSPLPETAPGTGTPP